MRASTPDHLRSSTDDGKELRWCGEKLPAAPGADSQEPVSKEHVIQELGTQGAGGERELK